MSKKTKRPLHPGYIAEEGIAYGSRVPGLLEIIFNTPENRNASNSISQQVMARLINNAQTDTSIKVILLHGGKYYSAGNNLDVLTSAGGDKEKEIKYGTEGIFDHMVPYVRAINQSVKPIVSVVRGGALGIGFTTLSLVDFVFVSPDAHFMTPFMQSFQSPEGSSTLNFPKIMGKRLAAEVLLLDKTLTAKEALDCGFVNAIIPELQDEPDFFDISKVPMIGKLLATDYRTLVNCKKLMNQAKDNEKFESTLQLEGDALLNSWLDEDFPQKLMGYMMHLAKLKKEKKEKKLRAKL